MNRKELVTSVAKNLNYVQGDVDDVLQGILDTIKNTVAEGEEVRLTNFGTVKSVERSAKMARNPQTGEAVKVGAKRVPVFKPARIFKEMVAGDDVG